jgi:hypothetical protein
MKRKKNFYFNLNIDSTRVLIILNKLIRECIEIHLALLN